MNTITLPTAQGELLVTPLGHGSVMMSYNGQVIHVDPYSETAKYDQLPAADQVWITHEHFDHLDHKAIAAIAKPTTVYVVNQAAATQLQGDVRALANGDSVQINGINIQAVPAYNIIRERTPGVKFHPKGRGNGYIGDFAGTRVYIAGDTEHIPEMADLKDITLAFLPINLPYTMDPQEAATAARTFSPAMLIPYHQGNFDPEVVRKALADTSITVHVFKL